MGVVARLQEKWYRWTGRAQLAEVVRAERETVEFLRESLADLEQRMFEPGWRRLTALAEQEFTLEGLRQITAVCRVMTLKNPMIRRGFALRAAYVWGQGVQITARDEAVNEVVQEFLCDPGNRRVFVGDQAHETLERALFTDGNVFLACFTNPRTGRVKVRVVPWDEIVDIITNPDDRSEPWFYRREWWADRIDGRLGARITERKIAFYPALGYRPARRPRTFTDRDGQTGEILWDAPLYHVKVGGLEGWKFGVGDAYAAVDWANAYREFLVDWARLVKALSRFAWRLTAKGAKQALAKAKIAAAPTRDPVTGEAQHAGATAVMPADMALEAVPKSGATIDAESGRPLAAMTASALDVPVTMLLGDPGTTGARATAETLDTPTERTMELRQGVWDEAIRAILTHVITESVRAPEGALRGRIVHDPYDNRETVQLDGGADTTVDIVWPDVDDIDTGALVEAIVKADSTTRIPPLVTARLLLQALNVRDVDGILSTLTDDDGNYIDPNMHAGQAAADRFRRGEDPAAAFGGGPGPGGEPDVPPLGQEPEAAR